MRTVKDKQILMAADFAGYPLKEAVRVYLEKKGWTVEDIGVRNGSDPDDAELMAYSPELFARGIYRGILDYYGLR